MKKPSITEWAQDCANIGRLMKRFANANAHLSKDELQKAETELNFATYAFACKYEVSQEYARNLAITMAESVDV